MKKTCRKQRYESESAALAAARAVTRGHAPRPPLVYRCRTCTKPNGQRAWHWANSRPGGRRRT